MNVFFVSDVHLGPIDNPRYEQFYKWLKNLKSERPTHLFFVGDIFDLWIEDHNYFKNKYQSIILEVQALIQEGVEVHYFEGNHDLYLKKFWQEELGVIVHEGPEYFQLGAWTVRVEHGDQMNLQDLGYLFLRWFLRTPIMKRVASQLPEAWVVKIGEEASKKSRAYTTSGSKQVASEVSILKHREHARRAYGERPFDWLISGHIHEADDYIFEVENGSKVVRAINLGTWLKKASVYKLDSNTGNFLNL